MIHFKSITKKKINHMRKIKSLRVVRKKVLGFKMFLDSYQRQK